MLVFLREACDGGRSRVAVFLRPGMPVGAGRILVGEMLTQRQKQAVPLQDVAALAPERLESAPARGIGRTTAGIEQLFQNGKFDRGDPGVVHKVLGTASLHVLPEGLGGDQLPRLRAVQQLGDRGHVDIEDVEQQTARRRIGTGVFGIIGKHRVQRIEANDIGPAIGGQFHQMSKVAEITDSPVATRAQQIKLRRNTPQTAVPR